MKREEILLEFINSNFKVLVCAVKASVLGKEWLGREINEEFIKDLKNLDVDICGENGEYHTFVYGGPIFKKPVNFTTGGRVLRDRDWFLELIL